MKKIVFVISMLVLVSFVSAAFAGPAAASPAPQSCWGQASKVFAQMGEMGEHSSSYPTPRLGLRNLARELYAAGIIADDSMAALGAFVADELGLTIEACQ
jgi:hypothetical protein